LLSLMTDVNVPYLQYSVSNKQKKLSKKIIFI